MLVTSYAFMQVFNAWNARTTGEKQFGIFAKFNYKLLFACLILLGLQLVFAQYGGRYWRSEPLSVD